jgi:hypothetical protein
MARVFSTHMLQDTNMFRWLWICSVCQGYVVHICYWLQNMLSMHFMVRYFLVYSIYHAYVIRTNVHFTLLLLIYYIIVMA